ncbi:unnamed protein product [Leuciscus chuanchicus]
MRLSSAPVKITEQIETKNQNKTQTAHSEQDTEVKQQSVEEDPVENWKGLGVPPKKRLSYLTPCSEWLHADINLKRKKTKINVLKNGNYQAKKPIAVDKMLPKYKIFKDHLSPTSQRRYSTNWWTEKPPSSTGRWATPQQVQVSEATEIIPQECPDNWKIKDDPSMKFLCNGSVTHRCIPGQLLCIETSVDTNHPLSEIPVHMELDNQLFTLRGVVAFIPGPTRESLGHYVAYCRRNSFAWEKYDDLCEHVGFRNVLHFPKGSGERSPALSPLLTAARRVKRPSETLDVLPDGPALNPPNMTTEPELLSVPSPRSISKDLKSLALTQPTDVTQWESIPATVVARHNSTPSSPTSNSAPCVSSDQSEDSEAARLSHAPRVRAS